MLLGLYYRDRRRILLPGQRLGQVSTASSELVMDIEELADLARQIEKRERSWPSQPPGE